MVIQEVLKALTVFLVIYEVQGKTPNYVYLCGLLIENADPTNFTEEEQEIHRKVY